MDDGFCRGMAQFIRKRQLWNERHVVDKTLLETVTRRRAKQHLS
jgi:hypothetical protein